MKKNFNRLAALALSGILVAGLAFPAMALEATADAPGFNKTINMASAELADVPNVNFKYTVATAEAEDVPAGNGTVHVYAGVAEGVSFSDVEFKDTDAINENKATAKATLTVNIEKFTKAGIYHYTVVEAQEKAVDGLTDKSAGEAKSFYVTIVNGDNGLEFSSLVFPDGGDAKAGDSLFESEYKTYSLTITKEVTGALGDKEMEFNFKKAISAANNNAEKYYTKDETAGATAVEKKEMPDEFKLSHDKSITIYGLSEKDVATITETVDANLGYTTTAEVNGATAAIDPTTGGGVVAVLDTYKENATLKVTNNREAVTPTGIVMDAAPYIVMLAAAGGLGAGFVLRKREDEE